jgi:hypothetical protein
MGMTTSDKPPKNLWQRLDGPLKIGLVFAALGIILTIIGIFRDPTVPLTFWSLGMGSLISGLVWGVVSWGIATAAVEVERDVSQAQADAVGEAKQEADDSQ